MSCLKLCSEDQDEDETLSGDGGGPEDQVLPLPSFRFDKRNDDQTPDSGGGEDNL